MWFFFLIVYPMSISQKELLTMLSLRKGTSLFRRFLQTMGVLALLFCLSAWSFAPSASQNTAFVRIVHAAPDVGIVDVFVDGTKLLSSFQFATVTEYVPLPAGSHHVQVALLGKGINAAMLAQTIMAQPNQTYTVAVVGTKTSGFSFAIFTDNNVVAGNTAKLRAYHLSPNTHPVNVNEGTATVIQGLGYQQDSNYIDLPTGLHAFSLSGVAANANISFSVNIKPWTVTSVFVIGLLNGKPGLQFVTAQIKGMPGMPNTGSDPYPQASSTSNAPTLPLWLPMILLVMLLGGCAWLYRVSSQRAE
jgi:hypothetical protein